MDTRPPPPQGAPPSYAFVTRVYRRNLRPIVITTAFLGALWSLFSGVRIPDPFSHPLSRPHFVNLDWLVQELRH
ncbi:hypothetical protein D9615_009503 [Tricholomella constricta]|uniref:Uncharacterized protein n=1 Tax=Tricholomella constricta TaxID=117010 RepID=A0A8H5LXY4_9AGAR|nr:hypothetical protein D9615_009503 [Tricholomella constricta]